MEHRRREAIGARAARGPAHRAHTTPNIARYPRAAYDRLRMRQSAADRPAALLEREREVERFAGVLREVAGGEGHALAIEAPAGMGKSRLLEEARRRAGGLGFCILDARATE